MPKSKTRKRAGRPVAMRHPASMRKALVTQRAVGQLCNDLDDLVAAVPLSYDHTNIMDVIQHHHHATAVVNFLRVNDVTGILAAMGGGDMIAVPEAVEDEAARYAAEAGISGPGAIGQVRRTEGFAPAHACRIMPTRECPPSYGAVCGDRPCARFESEDEAPWQASEGYVRSESGVFVEGSGAALSASVGGFATDTPTLERIVRGLVAEARPDPAPLTRAEQNARTQCERCGRNISRHANHAHRRHKAPGGAWCA